MDLATEELIKGYLEKAEKKLEVAEKLLESNDHEPAISRAYYAVYHASQALLLTEGQKAETHKGLVTIFSLFFIKTGKFKKDLGGYLANLKENQGIMKSLHILIWKEQKKL